ncbi:MAG: hypothetical protein CL917_03450 [Deltaproteobacteria bacterium]|nr:hypothetical protein [Deltaproteobacteria bacterium]
MRFIRWALAFIALVFFILLCVGVIARFGDGPTGFFPGGPLQAGDLYTGPEPDWTFARDIGEMEFELVEPEQSRTIWLQVHDQKLYVVSGYMNSPVGKVWKKWPAQAETDGRAVIRLNDRRYERQLVRILEDDEVLNGIASEVSRKYGVPFPAGAAESGDVWFFALEPRPKSS